ncbi:MAG: hypothetical protein K2X77_04500 [Candidatus Obscuribacterales bacterium]|jgi:hypothetical protein|nr:hypothetical protein [Candidatus Obscuribacterales bacterium]
MSTSKKRGQRGGAIAEFGTAFVVLVIFFFVPLVNLSFIAVKYFIAQGLIQEYVHRLAETEKRSEAYTMLSTDDWWKDFCDRCGVTVSGHELKLVVCGATGSDKITLSSGAPVTSQWLPGGSKAPCIYTLDLVVDVLIPPIYSGGPAVPGITSPLPLKIEGHSNWENLSRNPVTSGYFINE